MCLSVQYYPKSQSQSHISKQRERADRQHLATRTLFALSLDHQTKWGLRNVMQAQLSLVSQVVKVIQIQIKLISPSQLILGFDVGIKQ